MQNQRLGHWDKPLRLRNGYCQLWGELEFSLPTFALGDRSPPNGEDFRESRLPTWVARGEDWVGYGLDKIARRSSVDFFN